MAHLIYLSFIVINKFNISFTYQYFNYILHTHLFYFRMVSPYTQHIKTPTQHKEFYQYFTI